MMSCKNRFRNFYLFFLILLPLHSSLSGCSTAINNQVDKDKFDQQIIKPTAKNYRLEINNIERNYFLLKNYKEGKNTNKTKPPNKHLILVLSGSGCADTQPLLGHLFENMPINADFAELQKRGVKKNAYPSRNTRCSDVYYEHNNHANRAQDNLFLLNHLKKTTSYKKITLLGISEGVQIAYLMLNNDSTLNEVIFLANHAANSIEESYKEQAIFRDKTEPGVLNRYKKLLTALKNKGSESKYLYGGYVKNWRVTFNSDKRKMSEVLSTKRNVRYLFIMGKKDNLLPSEKLKETKRIFCRNKHRNNLMFYKNNTNHIVLNPPRYSIHKLISDWIINQPHQQSSEFTRLICE